MSFAAVVSEKFPKIRLTTEAQARFHRNKIELEGKKQKINGAQRFPEIHRSTI